MSESSDKIKGHLSKALEKAKVSFSSNGKKAGRVRAAVSTQTGVVFYIELDHIVTGAGSKDMGGISIEIPLYNILAPGQLRICPSTNGWYRATLSDGNVIESWYDAGKAQWSVKGEAIGSMHEIFMDGWAFPAIVVGIEKLGEIDPDMTDLVSAIEKIVVGDSQIQDL